MKETNPCSRRVRNIGLDGDGTGYGGPTYGAGEGCGGAGGGDSEEGPMSVIAEGAPFSDCPIPIHPLKGRGHVTQEVSVEIEVIIPTGKYLGSYYGVIPDEACGDSGILNNNVVVDVYVLNEISLAIQRACAVIGGRSADAVEAVAYRIAVDLRSARTIQVDPGPPPKAGSGRA